MKKSSVVILITVAILAAVIVAVVIAGAPLVNKSARSPDDAGPPIMHRYNTKIVYTTDLSLPEEPLRQDCAERGGTFNTCGTICPPNTAICAQVCAYTCEF